MCFKKHIYINSTLVSTIHITYKKKLIYFYCGGRNLFTRLLSQSMYTNIRRENFLYNFIKKFLIQFSLYINIYSVRKSWPHRIPTLFSYTISCAQYIYSSLVHSEISPYNIKYAKMTFLVMFLLTTFRHN